MNKLPLVSVLIPYYNGAEYIEEAIKSIVDQTYKNIEIIVINDCSPNEEDTSFLEKLKNKFEITLVNHAINSGSARALISGVLKSKGEYIAFLGQDDLYKKSKIEKQINYLEVNQRHVGCYCGGESLNNSTKERVPFQFENTVNKMKTNSVFPELYLFNGLSLTLQSLLIEKKIVKDLFFPIWNKLALDDWPAHIRLFESYSNEIGFVEETLFTYRVHENNISKNTYKIFAMTADVIATLCPEELKEKAIRRQIKMLNLSSENFFTKLFK